MGAVSKEERQFNLIVTLIAYPHGLKRDDLLSIVPGYSDDFDRFAAEPQFGILKNFERDKADIAKLGIVIHRADENEATGDNQNTRYFIRQSEYQFPESVSFSPQELQLLKNAAEAWRTGSMNLESRKALTKLRSLGYATDDSLIGVAPEITRTNEVFDALEEACRARSHVSFIYAKPGAASAEKRTVVPLALVDVYGQWHMYAFDTVMSGFRTFLLSRIVGIPSTVRGEDLDIPDGDYVQFLRTELSQLTVSNVAVVIASPESDAATRLSARYGSPDSDGHISIAFTDLDVLADDLCEFGSSVAVVAPPELIQARRSRFELIRRQHQRAKS